MHPHPPTPHCRLARSRFASLVHAKIHGVTVSMAQVGRLPEVSVGLSIYMARFGDFNQTYGSLGAVVGLMFWLYASAFVVLLGAEVNASMELRTDRDTTTGPPQPIGKRGAYVADHVA